jgi:hypothetical protein
MAENRECDELYRVGQVHEVSRLAESRLDKYFIRRSVLYEWEGTPYNLPLNSLSSAVAINEGADSANYDYGRAESLDGMAVAGCPACQTSSAFLIRSNPSSMFFMDVA